LDFGFWDILPSDKPKGYYNRLIEKKTEELNGFKSLYSDSYYTEEEFWRIYPKETFLELKAKYDPNNVFKGLYEKCVRRM
jgi:FAD/FMN-containing dehydrogenase